MGTWGEGPFDNDTASDWVFAFEEADKASGLNLIETTLLGAESVEVDDFLDSEAGSEAIAAAELVAAIRGLSVERSPYNEGGLDWVARTAPTADRLLVDLAIGALNRVVAANSELAQLWEESGSRSWRGSVEARRASLAG